MKKVSNKKAHVIAKSFIRNGYRVDYRIEDTFVVLHVFIGKVHLFFKCCKNGQVRISAVAYDSKGNKHEKKPSPAMTNMQDIESMANSLLPFYKPKKGYDYYIRFEEKYTVSLS